MKTLFALSLAFLTFSASSQCIDPSLIDPDVICISIYDPVCGCDGVTYSNSCIAEYQFGVTEWTSGECPSNTPCLDLSGIDFGGCALFLGFGYIDGVCVGISGCSTTGDNGYDYANSLYPTEAECTDACSNVTDCIDPDLIDGTTCTGDFDPVCGCDGVTYGNLCLAIHEGGVTSWVDGDCPPDGGCLDVGGIDFGPCDLVLGYAFANGVCLEVSGCSTTGDNGFDYADYIFATQQECEDACSNLSDCFDPDLLTEDPCPLFYDPVCGCDGVTYGNVCMAVNDGGVTSWTAGECPFECIDEDLIEDQPVCPVIIAPVCGCNGVTYQNFCYAEQLDGVTAWVDGECEDTDGDGVNDVLDCALFDPNIAPGFPCDDGDPNTSGDEYNECCVCEGISMLPDCPSDLNGDLVINTADLLLLLSDFGTTCE